MKKTIIALIVAIVIICTGCSYKGYDFIDTNYHYDMAQIVLPDGTIVAGEVEKWADADDGEQITIAFKDGNRYLVHAEDMAMWEVR